MQGKSSKKPTRCPSRAVLEQTSQLLAFQSSESFPQMLYFECHILRYFQSPKKRHWHFNQRKWEKPIPLLISAGKTGHSYFQQDKPLLCSYLPGVFNLHTYCSCIIRILYQFKWKVILTLMATVEIRQVLLCQCDDFCMWEGKREICHERSQYLSIPAPKLSTCQFLFISYQLTYIYTMNGILPCVCQ